MPVIHVYHKQFQYKSEISQKIRLQITSLLNLPENKLWIFWHNQDDYFDCDIWNNKENIDCLPIFFVYCKSKYSKDQIQKILFVIKLSVEEVIGKSANEIFIGVQKFQPNELFVNGLIYNE